MPSLLYTSEGNGWTYFRNLIWAVSEGFCPLNNKKKVPGTPEKECIQAVCLSAACQMCIDDKHLLKKWFERRQALPWRTRQAQQRDTKCLLLLLWFPGIIELQHDSWKDVTQDSSTECTLINCGMVVYRANHVEGQQLAWAAALWTHIT